MKEVTDMMVGKHIVTPHQLDDLYYKTTPTGLLCRCVYVMEMLETVKKFYISISLDRTHNCPVIKYLNLGQGIQYEKINRDYPHMIKSLKVDFLHNVRMEQLMEIAISLGIEQQKS